MLSLRRCIPRVSTGATSRPSKIGVREVGKGAGRRKRFVVLKIAHGRPKDKPKILEFSVSSITLLRMDGMVIPIKCNASIPDPYPSLSLYGVEVVSCQLRVKSKRDGCSDNDTMYEPRSRGILRALKMPRHE